MLSRKRKNNFAYNKNVLINDQSRQNKKEKINGAHALINFKGFFKIFINKQKTVPFLLSE